MTDAPAPSEGLPPPPTLLDVVGAAVDEKVALQGREDEREVTNGWLRAVDGVGVIIESESAYMAVPWTAIRRLRLPPP